MQLDIRLTCHNLCHSAPRLLLGGNYIIRVCFETSGLVSLQDWHSIFGKLSALSGILVLQFDQSVKLSYVYGKELCKKLRQQEEYGDKNAQSMCGIYSILSNDFFNRQILLSAPLQSRLQKQVIQVGWAKACDTNVVRQYMKFFSHWTRWSFILYVGFLMNGVQCVGKRFKWSLFCNFVSFMITYRNLGVDVEKIVEHAGEDWF